MMNLKQRFKDLPIQRKISLAILVTCSLALSVTGGGIFLVQLVSFRQSYTRDLQAIASIINHNCAAAVTYKYRNLAEQILSSLQAKPQILAASIELSDGSQLASFRNSPAISALTLPKTDGIQFQGPNLVLTQPITAANERLGTLRIIANYQSAYHRSLRLYATILGAVMVVSTLLALVVSRFLRKLIASPILRLTATAKEVANRKDYSLRAMRTASDEVGQLTDALNEMLAKTEKDDAALREANQRLEVEVAERQRTELALHTSERFMHSLVESLPQNIIRKDLGGRFTFANELFCRTVGRTKDQILGRTDFDLFPQELAAKFRRDDQTVIASGKFLETIEESKSPTGQKTYVQVIKAPLFDSENRTAGLQIIFWDVTEREQARQIVEQLNKKLLLTSRQAGMAEVATGVLHNVGNVLNSVNVSANVIESRLRQSRVNNLGKALAVLREHHLDLGNFLTADPKGKLLPSYLETLADHLAAEHGEVLQEMDLLSKNIEHIKEIVAMQQNYAKLCGVTEKVQAADLVQDALLMNLGAFERHGVHVQRKFETVPPVLVDRHKVLQILVNLMRNAKYALDERAPANKQLTVSIRSHGTTHVAIDVRDNGVGIAPENLTRIFGHGFTTKRDGHGFGLHSGALAAKEMGGQLRAQSDGLGKGAVFTLEVPVASENSTPSKAQPSAVLPAEKA